MKLLYPLVLFLLTIYYCVAKPVTPCFDSSACKGRIVDFLVKELKRDVIGKKDNLRWYLTLTIRLDMQADDAQQMMLSNNNKFKGAKWQPYQSSIDWTIPGFEGTSRLFVKWKNTAGQFSIDNAFISLDLNLPRLAPHVMINLNAEYCTNRKKIVELQLFALHAREMKISNKPSFKKARWQPYTSPGRWQLDGKDGKKTVYVLFRDSTGRDRKATDYIILDRQPPSGSVQINGSAATTASREVHLTMRSTGAVLMMLSNREDFAGARWQAYSEHPIQWQMADAQGIGKVYVKFKDMAGNESEAGSDEILVNEGK